MASRTIELPKSGFAIEIDGWRLYRFVSERRVSRLRRGGPGTNSGASTRHTVLAARTSMVRRASWRQYGNADGIQSQQSGSRAASHEHRRHARCFRTANSRLAADAISGRAIAMLVGRKVINLVAVPCPVAIGSGAIDAWIKVSLASSANRAACVGAVAFGSQFLFQPVVLGACLGVVFWIVTAIPEVIPPFEDERNVFRLCFGGKNRGCQGATWLRQ